MSAFISVVCGTLSEIIPVSAKVHIKDFLSFLRSVINNEENGQVKPDSLENQSEALVLRYIDQYLLPRLNHLSLLLINFVGTNEIDAPQKASTPSPSSIVSIRQCQTVYSSLEVLWHLQLSPLLRIIQSRMIPKKEYDWNSVYKLPVPDWPRSMGISPTITKSIMDLSESCSSYFDNLSDSDLISNFFEAARVFFEISTNDLFSTLILSRHLDRILLSLFILNIASNSDNSTFKLSLDGNIWIKASLDELSIYPRRWFRSLVVSKLRVFSSPSVPKRIIQQAMHMINKILLSENGLQNILEGYINDLIDTPHCTSVQVRLARMLAVPPKDLDHVNELEYLTNISRQLRLLWGQAMSTKDSTLRSSIAMIVARFSQVHGRVMDGLFFIPCSAALLSYIRGSKLEVESAQEEGLLGPINSSNSVQLTPTDMLASRLQVGYCVESLQALLETCPPLSSLCAAMERIGAIYSLFQMLLALSSDDTSNANSSLMRTIDALFIRLCTIDAYKMAELVFQWLSESAVSVSAMSTVVVDKPINSHRNKGCYKLVNEANSMVEVWQLTPEDAGQALSIEETYLLSHRKAVSVAKVMKQIVSVTGPSSESSESKAIRSVISSVFVQVLALYLKVGDCSEDDHSSRRSCGVAVMVLSEELPLDALLGSSRRILEIIASIITSHAHKLQEPPRFTREKNSSLTLTDANDEEEKLLLPGQVRTRRPLISDLTPLEDIPSTERQEFASSHAGAAADCEGEGEEDQSSLLYALNLLSGILTLGNSTRDSEEEAVIASLQSPLQRIAIDCKDASISEQATDIMFLIIERRLGKPPSASLSSASESAPSSVSGFLSSIETIATDHLEDISPVARAYGLKELSRLISSTPALLKAASSLTLSTLQQALNALKDEDSFVYLNAVLLAVQIVRASPFSSLAFSALVYRFAGRDLFQRVFLDRAFSSAGEIEALDEDDGAKSAPFRVASSLRHRALVAEVLQQCLKQRVLPFSHPGLSTLLKGLIACALRIAKVRPPVASSSSSSYATVDIFSGRRKRGNEGEEKEDDDDAVVRDAESAELIYLRQSALSLLAEAIPTAGMDAAPYILDIFDVCIGVLTMETEFSAGTRAGRRSAIFVLLYAIEKYSHSLFQSEGGFRILKELLVVLKRLQSSDKDQVVNYQTDEAIYLLGMRSAEFLGLDNPLVLP